MDENLIRDILETVKRLPTKEDLEILCQKLEESFQKELAKRDEKILELESKVNSLQDINKKNSELISTYDNKIKQIGERVHAIENNSAEIAVTPELHEVVVKNKLDLLVIGDSIIKYVDADKLNPGGKNKLICLPGGTIQDIRDRLIEVSKHNFIDNLIINVGINHIPLESPLAIINQLKKFFKEIKNNLPNTRLLYSGITPKTSKPLSRTISLINDELFKSSRNIGFKIIFHTRFFEEEINSNLLAKDRIHLNKHGVAVFASTLKYFFHH